MSCQVPQHALLIVLVATIGLPFIVLVVDYVLRIDTGLDDTMRSSGPDLCLLGLGSVGSIFLDPKVVAALVIPPQLSGAIVVFIIFAMRGFCFRLQKRPPTTMLAFVTMVLGLASVTIVGSILVYSYWS